MSLVSVDFCVLTVVNAFPVRFVWFVVNAMTFVSVHVWRFEDSLACSKASYCETVRACSKNFYCETVRACSKNVYGEKFVLPVVNAFPVRFVLPVVNACLVRFLTCFTQDITMNNKATHVS